MEWKNLKKRITVIGGAGYVGSVLVPKLLEKGHKVTLFDSFLFGEEPIMEWANHPDLEIVRADMRDMRLLSTYIQNAQVVICLAGIVGEPASTLNYKETIEVNYLAVSTLSQLCAIHKVDQFIFISSASVYGFKNDGVIADELSEFNPVDFYGETKVACEKEIAKHYANSTILRFGTLFGYSPRMRFDLVVNLFMGKLLENENIQLDGGGTQRRPFLEVEEAANSIKFCIDHNIKGVYNVAKDNYSIKEIAEMLKKEAPSSTSKLVVREEIKDKRSYCISSQKISEKGFKPSLTPQSSFAELKDMYGAIKPYSQKKYNNASWLKGKENES